MRYRDGTGATAAFMEPGKIYRATVDLAATSNVFLAGHRMRVEISSSNFPRFDRNLNTEESPELGTRRVKATNTIHHDAAHPSALVASVVPE
jgi:putative CocE/NonD family hydrolase